jgi:hypothetical protein
MKKIISFLLLLLLFPSVVYASDSCGCSEASGDYDSFSGLSYSSSMCSDYADKVYLYYKNGGVYYRKLGCIISKYYGEELGYQTAMWSNSSLSVMSKSQLQDAVNNHYLTYVDLLDDYDSDGISDYSEIMQEDGDYQDSSVQPAAGELSSPDTDGDGLSDYVEDVLGTDPTVVNASVSWDYSGTTIANYDPEDIRMGVVFLLDDGSYVVVDDFIVSAMDPFGDPGYYTLGDYGEGYEDVDLILCEVEELADDVLFYDTDNGTSLGSATGSSGSNSSSAVGSSGGSSPTVSYTGGGDGVAENNEDAVETVDNSDTAGDAWDEELEVLDGEVDLEDSTEADTQIDPKDVAKGIVLAEDSLAEAITDSFNDVTYAEDPLLIDADSAESVDTDINSQFDDLGGILDGLGDTVGYGVNWDSNDVLTSSEMDDAIGFISWVDDLYTVPTIGSQSSFTIDGWTYNGYQFNDIVIDFDKPVVTLIRQLFLFFFYFSCIWIFFKLTRYAWG